MEIFFSKIVVLFTVRRNLYLGQDVLLPVLQIPAFMTDIIMEYAHI